MPENTLNSNALGSNKPRTFAIALTSASLRNLAIGVFASLLYSSAQAQGDFYNWTEFSNWCVARRGTPLRYPPRCIPNQSARAPISPTQSDGDFVTASQTYSALVSKIAKEADDPAKFMRTFGEEPKNSDDLSEKVPMLHDFVSHRRVVEATLLGEVKDDYARTLVIANKISAKNSEADALQEENKKMLNYVYAARRDTSLMATLAVDEQKKALNWFNYVAPNDLPKHGSDTTRAGVGTGLISQIPSLETYEEHAERQLPVPNADVPIRVIPPGDTNTQKLQYVADGYADLLNLKIEHASIDTKIDYKWLADKEDELYGLKRSCNKAIFDGEQLARQVKVFHQNFVVQAVEGFVWKTYVTHISIEEARKFYDLNKSWYQLSKASQITDDTVLRDVQAGKSALGILGSQAKGLNEFVNVEKRTLDLINDAQRFISEAPAIAALATPAETRAFLGGGEKMQNEYYIDVMQETQAGLSSPYSRFARSLKDMKLPKQYQSIARKLGLVN